MVPKTCSVCGTGGKITRGWCGPHYQRWRRTGDPLGGGPDRCGSTSTDEEALQAGGWIVTPRGCWEWQSATKPEGYGKLGHKGVSWLAHRLAYQTWVGPIPEGFLIRHRCDNPPCINPAHLTPGRHKENAGDAVRRRRFANGSRTGGAKLTDAQVDAIRERRASGEPSKSLAAEFRVHPHHIAALVARRYRKARTNPPLASLE